MKNKDTFANKTVLISLLVLTCFFFSGLSSLIYQILWTKMIVKIIGTAPFAVAIVLTIFMAGLGVGSFLASRFIDRVKEPAKLVKIYGILEIIIGLYAVAVLPLLESCRPIYAVLYNRLFSHFLLYNFLTFIGCAFILSIPVICMGATLPVLCRFYITRLSHVGTHAGKLYGLNTIGAAVGALFCGFWLIKYLGVWGTLSFAVSINILIGIVCYIVSFWINKTSLFKYPQNLRAVSLPEATEKSSVFVANAALIIFAVSGFCAMAYEVLWTRLLGLVVGPTTYSFTIVLVSFITGIALGSIVFGRFADKVKNIFLLLIATQAATALFALIVSQLLGNSQLFFAKLIFTFQDSFTQLNLIKAVVLFVFLFLPTFFSGATFPLVGKLYTRSIDSVGRSIGFAYVLNTIGAVAGSFCAGFVLIPLLGRENSLSFVIGLQLFTILILLIPLYKSSLHKWRPACMAASILFCLVLCLFYPVWNRYLIGSGRYHRFERMEMYLRTTGWLESFFPSSQFLTEEEHAIGKLIYYGDGIGGFTTVFKNNDEFGNESISMANSGKFDASSRGDMATETMLTHFPMLFHPNPKNVMVLGLASGITAGETLCYPIDKLDIVEISTNVVKASHFFDKWNNNVLANPKTNLIIQDGRAHLYLTNQKYDVIISEPSNPWMAGMADLFTRDFFLQARKKLNDRGILCQWVHIYQMNWDTFALICRTFADAFPDNMLVKTYIGNKPGDFLLLGFKGENKLDLTVASEKTPFIRKSSNISLSDCKLFYPFIVSEDIKKLVGPGALNTDNRPILEFEAQRAMYSSIGNAIDTQETLTQNTKAITSQVLSDVDLKLDLMDYLFSVYTPFLNLINIDETTGLQKDRYQKMLESYCTNNPLDLSHLPKGKFGQYCRTIQINALKNKISSIEDKYSAYLYLSSLYAQNNLLEDTVASAKEAVKENPKLYEGHVYLGNLFVSQGKLNEAAECFKNALKIMPRNFIVHNKLGIVLSQQFNFDEAISHFEEAVRLKPDFSEAYLNFGHVLFQKNSLDEAMKKLNVAAKIDPNLAAAQIYLAQVCEKKGQIDNAIVHYKRAIKLKPDWAVGINSAAWLMAVKKDAIYHNPKEALLLAKKACDLTKEAEPAVLDTLAAAYAAGNEFKEAVQTAEKALNLAKTSNQTEVAGEIEKHLKLYKTNQAYFEAK